MVDPSWMEMRVINEPERNKEHNHNGGECVLVRQISVNNPPQFSRHLVKTLSCVHCALDRFETFTYDPVDHES